MLGDFLLFSSGSSVSDCRAVIVTAPDSTPNGHLEMGPPDRMLTVFCFEKEFRTVMILQGLTNTRSSVNVYCIYVVGGWGIQRLNF